SSFPTRRSSDLKLRAIAINVNYRYVHGELRYLFNNADIVALVHDQSYADTVGGVLPECPQLKHVIAIADESGADYVRYGGVAYAPAPGAGPSGGDAG